jgi:hypothetical protein
MARWMDYLQGGTRSVSHQYDLSMTQVSSRYDPTYQLGMTRVSARLEPRSVSLD